MARLIEHRVVTLELAHGRDDAAQCDQASRFVRLDLVERQALLHGFNVRETRTQLETDARGRALESGRWLSWRWLGRHDAERLLDARFRTLDALGYRPRLNETPRLRGPWDWLSELVQRQLVGTRNAEQTTAMDDEAPARSLLDALERVGLGCEQVIEGIAEVTHVHPTRLEYPDPETFAQIDRPLLAAIVAFSCDHTSARLRSIGERWLALRITAYELPVALLERWLMRPDDHHPSRCLIERIPDEGLALLGPSSLVRLAEGSKNPRVRTHARTWVRRMPEIHAA